MTGMTTKITVSLPDEQVEAARAAVAEGRAPSVSAYVSEALARRSAEDELLHLLDDDETREPATQKHRTWARRALGDEGPGPASAPKRPAGSTASDRRRTHDLANQLGPGPRRRRPSEDPTVAEPHRQTEPRTGTTRQRRRESTSDK